MQLQQMGRCARRDARAAPHGAQEGVCVWLHPSMGKGLYAFLRQKRRVSQLQQRARRAVIWAFGLPLTPGKGRDDPCRWTVQIKDA